MIYCCGCEKDVEARLTNGSEIYPKRPDLSILPFWKCDACGNYVGCHHKTDNPTAPLGNIPTKAIRQLRQQIHSVLDPLWKQGIIGRKALYGRISKELGWTYHTGQIRSENGAKKVLVIVNNIKRSLV